MKIRIGCHNLSKNFVSRHFAVSMFNIVKFPNDECEGDGGKNGTCYTGMLIKRAYI